VRLLLESLADTFALFEMLPAVSFQAARELFGFDEKLL